MITKPTAPTAVLQGLKFFKPLRKLLGCLHADHAHPNRKLHYDAYFSLLLTAYFNPMQSTLRQIQQISDLKTAQKRLGVRRASLGSLSEASHVFDPELLRHIFLELSAQARPDALPRPRGVPEDLQLLAADGTLWETLPRMAQTLWLEPLRRGLKGGFKGHFQFDVLAQVPTDVHFTEGNADERATLKAHLKAGVLYLLDRGYIDYALYEQLGAVGSSFVARLKAQCACRVLEERVLPVTAQAAGVYQDATVRVGGNGRQLERPLRVVKARVVSPPPHNLHPTRKRGKHRAHAPAEPLIQELILLTDRFDLEAEVVLALYRYRWQVEIFFRWLKCILGCRHLLAQSTNGLTLQIYVALIASVLIVLWTGRKPNVSVLRMIVWYLDGWASWPELKRTLERTASVAQ